MLRDRCWRRKYTTDDDLVGGFYVPALRDAVRYDRLSGYFGAGALALAARGVEGLAANDGRMRLVVGCTLDPPEVAVIQEGLQLRARVEQRLAAVSLDPPDEPVREALELLGWMVARGILDVQVAVPRTPDGRLSSDDALFHEKTGIIEDRAGDRIAWSGSLNESVAGWTRNWESISVFTSWDEPKRVEDEESGFAAIWEEDNPRLLVMDVPEAVRRKLLRAAPKRGLPVRLRRLTEEAAPADIPRNRVWSFLAAAPALASGSRIGEATAAVTPWPHQTSAFERLYGSWPPRLLIADEVGLGKTIQAGMLLRQACLAGKAKRVLILAPHAVLPQWQLELREKFHLHWPIYDRGKLRDVESPSRSGDNARDPPPRGWHAEPAVIASSHLLRRRDRRRELLEDADPWDVIVVDEAHHARRRGAATNPKDEPNALLRLLRDLRTRTKGLVLLTATPMQVHPIEVWDLLALLGLPPEWTSAAFLQFVSDLDEPGPPTDAFDRLARLFRAAEAYHGAVADPDIARLTRLPSRLAAKKVARALRDPSPVRRANLDRAGRAAAVRLARRRTPITARISRNTRRVLRRYHADGRLTIPVAARRVEDRFEPLSDGESALYEAVERYISSVWERAAAKERNAVGFVLTVYRRRLASSVRALRETLVRRREALGQGARALGAEDERRLAEDTPDDELTEEAGDAEAAARAEKKALAVEEEGAVAALLAAAAKLPPDSKVKALRRELAALRKDGHRQAMVFTMFTDTMDFLREELAQDGGRRILCFSGRGGEARNRDGGWDAITRDEARRRFREGAADILLCTDAAAEGLNFQFCGALVNYDLPWNPMRVEQRIGRIDRLGQQHPTIRIVNLYAEGTVETDVYRALRDRFDLFEQVVGRAQPILSQTAGRIREAVLGGPRETSTAAALVARIEEEARRAEAGFDLDEAMDDGEPELDATAPPPSPITMEALDRLLRTPELLPPGWEVVKTLGRRQYALRLPGCAEPLWVTTDPAIYERHTGSMELWTPGSPVFPSLRTGPAGERSATDPRRWEGVTLVDLLEELTETGGRRPRRTVPS